jgi:hypothetical protein
VLVLPLPLLLLPPPPPPPLLLLPPPPPLLLLLLLLLLLHRPVRGEGGCDPAVLHQAHALHLHAVSKAARHAELSLSKAGRTPGMVQHTRRTRATTTRFFEFGGRPHGISQDWPMRVTAQKTW